MTRPSYPFWGLLALLALLVLPSCASDESPMDDATANATRTASGDSKAGTASTKVVLNPAVTQNGTATTHYSDVKSERNSASSATGQAGQFAFTLGLTMKTAEALAFAMEKDPVVGSIVLELETLQAAEIPDTARIDALRAQLGAELKRVTEEHTKATGGPGALASLQNLTVTNIHGNVTTGAEPDPVTEATAKAAGQIQGIVTANHGGRSKVEEAKAKAAAEDDG